MTITRVRLSLSSPFAFLARTQSALIGVGILLVVGMIAGAMGDLAFVFGCIPSAYVFPMRNGLKMARVDATADAACMIEFQPIGHRANKNGIAGDVSADRGSFGPDDSIAVFIEVGKPNPASRVGDDLDVAQKTFWQCKLGCSHCDSFRESHRSGSRGATNASAGRFHFTAEGGV